MGKNYLWDRSKFGLFMGIILFFIMLLLPLPNGLSQEGWRTAAVAILMGTWWITEAIPIPATAFLPIVLFPVLGISTIDEATAPYANPLIYLFMGGFVIAIAMERWQLHKRIALNIVNFVGTKPSSIIMGFIIASAFLSMWVSNTATSLMMLPIALSVLDLIEKQSSGSERMNFEIVLVLSLAYACNIGGMATIIGTPPNALLVGYISQSYGIEISFLQWMLVGIPIVVVSLPIVYFILTKVVFPIKLKKLPGGREFIESQLLELGGMTGAEKKVATVFIVTALLWIIRPLLSDFIPGLSDAGIAVAAAAALFLIPVNFKEGRFVLEWKDTRKLPWGVLVLFGGGLSLASAISNTGLAEWIGSGTKALQAWPVVFLLATVILVIVFLTEITSNTATTAASLPILASAALGLGQNPLLFTIPAAFAASCAFMLPVATPPNAIVYGSGRVTLPEMSRAGLWLNIVFIILLTVFSYTIISWVFGIKIGVIPG